MRFAHIGIVALALASAGGAQAPDWRAARPIEIALSNFRFSPATLVLQQGVAYRLHLSNTASGSHDFAAGPLFASSEIAADDRAKVKNGVVALPGPSSADILLMPLKAGSYPFRCTHFMHSTFGMKGVITVR